MTIELTHERTESNADLITSQIAVTAPLTEDQRARLEEIAGRCRVHRTIEGGPAFVERLTAGTP